MKLNGAKVGLGVRGVIRFDRNLTDILLGLGASFESTTLLLTAIKLDVDLSQASEE